jgi:hypothetical protein
LTQQDAALREETMDVVSYDPEIVWFRGSGTDEGVQQEILRTVDTYLEQFRAV